MTTELARQIESVRRFNRFYTRRIGVLHEGLLESPFSLTEARVLYELAHRDTTTATDLGQELGLDTGYLSRVLRRLRDHGLVEKHRSARDGRQSHLFLTPAGKAAFASLDTSSKAEIVTLLEALDEDERMRTLRAMHTIESVLGERGEASEPRVPYLLRPPEPGDMGYIVHRHGLLYAREYGFDESFEALVAEIVARYVQRFDPRTDRCWIAEREGEIVGSVFLVKKSKTVGQLRLLFVEPKARGLGIGRRLVDECCRFGQRVGYKKITLWTNSILHAARHIYERAGFELVDEQAHHSFGCDLVGQNWEKKL